MQVVSVKALFKSLPVIIFLAALVFTVFSLCKGWHGAIIDLHSFRQTQTAITVTSLLRGGPWLAYETPVFGPPWSIPLEFPLYQWLVALTAHTKFLPVEESGRLISILMFLATFYPLYRILKSLQLTGAQICLVLSLYCFSPEYLFWSRTFMIESTALALSLYFLMLIVMLHDRPGSKHQRSWPMLIGIAVIGALAAMVKVTTFMTFFAAGAVFFGWKYWSQAKALLRGEHTELQPFISFFIFAVIIPVTALFLWTAYCDALKSLNPIARNILTSSALQHWNFGSLDQRLSLQTWKIFFIRNLRDLIGNSWLMVLAIPATLLCRRERLTTVALLLGLFLLPMLVFTNLHFRHNYYAYANGVFLIVAVGLICSELWMAKNRFKRAVGITLFCVAIAYSSHHYLTIYSPRQGMAGDFSYLKNDMDRNMAGKDDIIIVYGASWSSEIPYYLDRRAVMMLDFGDDTIKEVVQNLQPYQIGAVLFYGQTQHNSQLKREALETFGVPPTRMKDYGQIMAYFK